MELIRKIVREELEGIQSSLKIVPAHMDKHTSIQLSTKSEDLYNRMKALFYELKTEFPDLKFFLQSDVKNSFLMFEPWSKDQDRIFEAAQWISGRLGVDLSI